MNNDLLIVGLILVIVAWLVVIWYLYRYYQGKGEREKGKVRNLEEDTSNDLKTYQLENDSPRSVGDFIGDLKSEGHQDQSEVKFQSSSNPQTSEIIEDAVTQAKRTLEDTEYFKKRCC